VQALVEDIDRVGRKRHCIHGRLSLECQARNDLSQFHDFSFQFQNALLEFGFRVLRLGHGIFQDALLLEQLAQFDQLRAIQV